MRFFEQQDQARSRTLRLVLLFAVAVAATVAGVHLAMSALWWLLHQLLHLPYPRLFATANVGITLALVIGGWWIETSNLQLPGGIQRLAHRLGAREVRPDGEPPEKRLCNVVDELCIAANMPHPEVMVLPRTQAINAFAAGWDRHDAVVAVTQGALDLLTREELQGLVAHECSHVHEGDTRLNMQLAGMVSGLELVWRFGQAVREGEGLGAILGAPIQWAGAIGWMAARALQASVSRQREFLADARAVQWTRSRDGLGGVLRKALAQRGEVYDVRSDDPAWPLIAHHLLLVGHEDRERTRWFDAHPPLALRIERIYGHPMPPLPLDDARAATVPAMLE